MRVVLLSLLSTDNLFNYSCKCGFGNLGENCEIESFGFNWNSFVQIESFHKVSNSIYFEFATSKLIIYINCIFSN